MGTAKTTTERYTVRVYECVTTIREKVIRADSPEEAKHLAEAENWCEENGWTEVRGDADCYVDSIKDARGQEVQF